MSAAGNALAHETLTLRPAWDALVRRYTTADPAANDPHDLHGALCFDADERQRAAALLFADRLADTMADAHALIIEVRAWARDGRRPRSLADVWPSPSDIGLPAVNAEPGAAPGREGHP